MGVRVVSLDLTYEELGQTSHESDIGAFISFLLSLPPQLPVRVRQATTLRLPATTGPGRTDGRTNDVLHVAGKY